MRRDMRGEVSLDGSVQRPSHMSTSDILYVFVFSLPHHLPTLVYQYTASFNSKVTLLYHILLGVPQDAHCFGTGFHCPGERLRV